MCRNISSSTERTSSTSIWGDSLSCGSSYGLYTCNHLDRRKMPSPRDGTGAGQQSATVRPTVRQQLQMLREAKSLPREEPRGGTSEEIAHHLSHLPIKIFQFNFCFFKKMTDFRFENLIFSRKKLSVYSFNLIQL